MLHIEGQTPVYSSHWSTFSSTKVNGLVIILTNGQCSFGLIRCVNVIKLGEVVHLVLLYVWTVFEVTVFVVSVLNVDVSVTVDVVMCFEL